MFLLLVGCSNFLVFADSIGADLRASRSARHTRPTRFIQTLALQTLSRTLTHFRTPPIPSGHTHPRGKPHEKKTTADDLQFIPRFPSIVSDALGTNSNANALKSLHCAFARFPRILPHRPCYSLYNTRRNPTTTVIIMIHYYYGYHYHDYHCCYYHHQYAPRRTTRHLAIRRSDLWKLRMQTSLFTPSGTPTQPGLE